MFVNLAFPVATENEHIFALIIPAPESFLLTINKFALVGTGGRFRSCPGLRRRTVGLNLA
jgi:hypothetical protein